MFKKYDGKNPFQKGDLVKIQECDYPGEYMLGIFIEINDSEGCPNWATFYIDLEKKYLFLYDYMFEII